MTKKITSSNRQISVLVVTTSFPTKENPVSGIFVKRLIDHFSSDTKVTVLTPCGFSPGSLSESPHYNVICFRYAPWRLQKLAHSPGGIPAALEQGFVLKLLFPLFMISFFIYAMRAIPKVDVVHANWSVNGFICGLANIFAKRPLILTLRGTDFSKSTSSRLFRFLLRNAMRFSDVITVVSEAMHQNLSIEYPKFSYKLSTIPNGVDNDLLRVPLRNSRQTNLQFNILIIANLIKLKKVDIAIKAIANLKDKLKLNLTIVGDGPEKNHLYRLTKELEVERLVTFKGIVTPKQIPNYMRQADCLVLTSASEGKPNVVLEAFASGLPVIATNIDGVREMIGDNENGLLYESSDDRQLAQKLQELFCSEVLYQKFSENGRKYILEKNLTWRDSAIKYSEVYKSLVSQNQAEDN